MYYLQATVYEAHGKYDVHAYLWRRQEDSQDLLCCEAGGLVQTSEPYKSEHAEILGAIGVVLSGIAQKADGLLF